MSAARLVDPEGVLETERLLLEPLLRRHAAGLFPMLRSPEIYRYVPQEPPDTRNAASVKLLERLGFERVGYRPGADFFKGARSDEYSYRLLAPAPG